MKVGLGVLENETVHAVLVMPWPEGAEVGPEIVIFRIQEDVALNVVFFTEGEKLVRVIPYRWTCLQAGDLFSVSLVESGQGGAVEVDPEGFRLVSRTRVPT